MMLMPLRDELAAQLLLELDGPKTERTRRALKNRYRGVYPQKTIGQALHLLESLGLVTTDKYPADHTHRELGNAIRLTVAGKASRDTILAAATTGRLTDAKNPEAPHLPPLPPRARPTRPPHPHPHTPTSPLARPLLPSVEKRPPMARTTATRTSATRRRPMKGQPHESMRSNRSPPIHHRRSNSRRPKSMAPDIPCCRACCLRATRRSRMDNLTP